MANKRQVLAIRKLRLSPLVRLLSVGSFYAGGRCISVFILERHYSPGNIEMELKYEETI